MSDNQNDMAVLAVGGNFLIFFFILLKIQN